MEEIDAYNDYDEEDDDEEIDLDGNEVPRREHGRSLSGKFNAITDLNKLRSANIAESNDYGSPELDDELLNEQEYMRRMHNQQMYQPNV